METVAFNADGKSVDPNTGIPILPPQEEPSKTIDIQAIVNPGGTSGDFQKNLQGVLAQHIQSRQGGIPGSIPIPKQAQQAQQIPQRPFTRKSTFTKYEVKPDTTFKIEFGIVERDGRYVVIRKDEVQFSKGTEPHWVLFRMWGYREELEWKNKATEYDAERRVHSMNNDVLNELKLRNLLLDWSFSEKEPELKLMHVNRILSDESIEMFFSFYPSVVRYMVDKMNEVLEGNG